MQTETGRSVLVVGNGAHALAIRAALAKAGRDDIAVVETDEADRCTPAPGHWSHGSAVTHEALAGLELPAVATSASALKKKLPARMPRPDDVVEMTDRNGNRGYGFDMAGYGRKSEPGAKLPKGELLTRLRERRGFYDVLTGPAHPVPGDVLARRLSFAQARDCARREAKALCRRANA
jgi:hypothetical protein